MVVLSHDTQMLSVRGGCIELTRDTTTWYFMASTLAHDQERGRLQPPIHVAPCSIEAYRETEEDTDQLLCGVRRLSDNGGGKECCLS